MSETAGQIERHPENRLAREKSPYLLQHSRNPVDWYAWGEEAFNRARAENKPIFLSIGYATCHWCHVMERESFESEEVARFLNEHFISIKVDREERPDVDRIYMTFVQATTGSGGWPLTAFLTPELKPFYGGTYFPPENRHGRPGFLQILQNVHQLWKTRGGELTASANEIHARLQQVSAAAPAEPRPQLGIDTLQAAADRFKNSYDPAHGGFGGAPKFPHPAQPQFLLRAAKRFDDVQAANMILHTADRMAAGGIHDQLGGGFSRYSVDAEWLVPHFEKMLYDNAQLAQLYLDTFVYSGDERHAEVVRGILGYVLRDMTHPDGGFYSAEDADSEGHEGKFYCWTQDELRDLLSPEEFEAAVSYFGITARGNFVDHSHPAPLRGQNVLSIVGPEVQEKSPEVLAAAKEKMFAALARRVRPGLDDKILSSWNGLMLGAFARAHAVLGDERYLAAAGKNLDFLKRTLWEESSRTLYHRWRDGERDQAQLLEAYAFLLSGVLELYECTVAPGHLEFAVALARSMIERFHDPEHGGFWQTPPGTAHLIVRLKQEYDGAEPSGASVATLALLKLGRITGLPEFSTPAEKSLGAVASQLTDAPQALSYMLQALDFSVDEPRRVVIAGQPEDPATKELLRAAHSVYQPHKVVLGTHGPVEPFARSLPEKGGPVAYVCTGTECQPLTRDPEQLRTLLG